ncbi:hypothetical protein L1987_83707 [Smallanthus sonchifolius]|uniref:Uncharacterized protein n=1 Tax=Smallanthus sonchifolius TaxID=185202 RepID=A0ACB8YC17_9ASTR|nr:hypothetical protein L1987_83707 [Smallanthus sonchifolius]
MFVTCAHEDRISNLPEQLIVSILEKLPVQDAVRTSILSKNWRALHLVNCILKPPLEFQRFPNLESLSLGYVDFGANSGRTVIDLPRLKILLMAKCTNACNFNIKASKLQTLNVIACPDAALFQLFHSQYLTTFFICSSMKPIQGSAQVEKVSLTRMLSNLPNIAYFLKFNIAEDIPKWLPHKLNSLKHLHLLNTKIGDLGQLQPALYHQDIYFDEEAALSYLESSDCLD